MGVIAIRRNYWVNHCHAKDQRLGFFSCLPTLLATSPKVTFANTRCLTDIRPRPVCPRQVSGPLPARPVTSFAHFGFDEGLLKAIRKMEYTQPTPIQSQAVPVALGGRDVIGTDTDGAWLVGWARKMRQNCSQNSASRRLRKGLCELNTQTPVDFTLVML